jgi:hypothetical protein
MKEAFVFLLAQPSELRETRIERNFLEACCIAPFAQQMLGKAEIKFVATGYRNLKSIKRLALILNPLGQVTRKRFAGES